MLTVHRRAQLRRVQSSSYLAVACGANTSHLLQERRLSRPGHCKVQPGRVVGHHVTGVDSPNSRSLLAYRTRGNADDDARSIDGFDKGHVHARWCTHRDGRRNAPESRRVLVGVTMFLQTPTILLIDAPQCSRFQIDWVRTTHARSIVFPVCFAGDEGEDARTNPPTAARIIPTGHLARLRGACAWRCISPSLLPFTSPSFSVTCVRTCAERTHVYRLGTVL